MRYRCCLRSVRKVGRGVRVDKETKRKEDGEGWDYAVSIVQGQGMGKGVVAWCATGRIIWRD
jgi:hypothetical protein